MAYEVGNCIKVFTERQQAEVVELNIQPDHAHALVMVPPKVSISDFVGTVKGRTAIRVLNNHRNLKSKPYWGNHFWSKGYCVDTVGPDAEMIRKYVKYRPRKKVFIARKPFSYVVLHENWTTRSVYVQG